MSARNCPDQVGLEGAGLSSLSSLRWGGPTLNVGAPFYSLGSGQWKSREIHLGAKQAGSVGAVLSLLLTVDRMLVPASTSPQQWMVTWNYRPNKASPSSAFCRGVFITAIEMELGVCDQAQPSHSEPRSGRWDIGNL